jgi:hypothetical protein
MRSLNIIQRQLPKYVSVLLAVTITVGCGGDDDGATEEAVADSSNQADVEAIDSSTAPAPTTAPTVPQTTSPASTAAPSPTAVEPWDELPGWSGQEFGRVRALFFEPELSFEAPEGSRLLCPPGPRHAGIAVTEDGLDMSPSPPGSHPAGLLILRLGEQTVDEAVAVLADGVSAPTDPQPVTLDGATGVTFDGTAPLDEPTTLYLSPTGDCSANFDLGQAWRFWVVEVNDTPVTFAAYSSTDQFTNDIAELETVLASVEWRSQDE